MKVCTTFFNISTHQSRLYKEAWTFCAREPSPFRYGASLVGPPSLSYRAWR